MSTESKQFFFIRHGQSVGNIKKEFQKYDEPLSELGEKQAEFVAKRIKTLNPETILTSPMERAKKTADIIKKEINIPLELHDFFAEARGPSNLIGKKYESEEGKKYIKLIFENIHNPNWHYSDEENFFDLTKRAKEVIEHLENRKERKIIIVTHGAFMRSVLSTMMTEGEPDALTSLRMIRFLGQKNTGITICEHNQKENMRNKWKLITWNDHAHLGELKDEEPVK